MIWGLQRRLLVLLMLPLGLVAVVSVWLHYQNAGTAALQQDQQLLRLVPLLADSVVVRSRPRGRGDEPPVEPDDGLGPDPGLAMLLAPPVDEFLKAREGFSAYGIFNEQGRLLLGDTWLPTVLPVTQEAELLSVVEGGVTYRVVAQRSSSSAGELILMLADGSDAQQNWLSTVMIRVLLPNLLLLIVAASAVTWAVHRALRPLIDLKQAVERRSPRDLSPLAVDSAPTEVRPLVASLNRLFALVNAQAESQRRFVADAAHQLRTPLAGLQAQVEAWAQSARGVRPGDRVPLPADQLLKLRDATRRTSQLANQLLALSRADSLSADAQPMLQVDLQDLCETVLPLFLDATADKRIDLGLEAAPAQILGHGWLLRELVINLVDNAVRYTPVAGHVTLRCGHGGRGMPDGAWIEVEDSGPGISADEMPRVLQRFYRIPGTGGEGNGLGLAIASEIARAHHTSLQMLQASSAHGLLVRVVFAPLVTVRSRA
ncbi:MAG: ATP-binding protein [Burkholderiaceae bacterium]